MLEHVPEPASVIAACAALVKPGGDVIFSTIKRNPKAFALAVVGAEYVMNLVPRGTHEYEKFIRPSELDGWARHRSEEHTSELQSLMRTSYAVFCLKKKNKLRNKNRKNRSQTTNTK